MGEGQFLENVQLQIYENVKFADQKATAFIAIDSAIFAGIFSREVAGEGFTFDCVFLSLLALAIGITLAVCVVWPRLSQFAAADDFPTEEADLLLPAEITRGTVVEYAKSLRTEGKQFENQLAAYVYLLSKIYLRKYLFLKLCIIFSAAGILIYAANAVLLG